jgi:transglutaminase-like putative cysteine protease
MRVRISHETAYHYDSPAKSAIQLLRLTPRNHEGQLVRSWWVDLDRDGRLVRREDCYGNITHALFLDGAIEAITITVHGEVESEDTAGLVKGAVERFPASFYLRNTRLTKADAAIEALADEVGQQASDPLERAHALLLRINSEITFDVGATVVTTTAAQAFQSRHGVCQDLTHIFIAAAHRLGIPARYVSGYLVQSGNAEQDASHAWAEAYLDGLGWVSFDPANGISATEQHIRIAIGLDYLDAAPIRGSFYGGQGETLSVRVRVQETQQAQS